MEPVFVLNPNLFVCYTAPTICRLCGLKTDTGQHMAYFDDTDPPTWGCRVPMPCVSPAKSARINSL